MLPLLPGYKLAFGRQVAISRTGWRTPTPTTGTGSRDVLIRTSLPPRRFTCSAAGMTLSSTRRWTATVASARPVALCGWSSGRGTTPPDFSTDMPVIAGEALSWLHSHLVGTGDAPGSTPVRVHVGQIGGRGEWRDLADWPPPGAATQSWHLHLGGTLAASGGEGTSRLRYDPHDPTPSVGGPRMDSKGYGPKDTGKLEARDDVLTFTGPVIGEPQDVIGPVSLRLKVRGSSPNFDIFARLCEVDANGTSWNICDGLLRLDGTRPADAGGWRQIEVPMSATAHCFAAGHRIRVQVSGGAHPRCARNTGAREIATATTLVPVDIEICHRDAVLSLPVLPAAG